MALESGALSWRWFRASACEWLRLPQRLLDEPCQRDPGSSYDRCPVTRNAEAPGRVLGKGRLEEDADPIHVSSLDDHLLSQLNLLLVGKRRERSWCSKAHEGCHDGLSPDIDPVEELGSEPGRIPHQAEEEAFRRHGHDASGRVVASRPSHGGDHRWGEGESGAVIAPLRNEIQVREELAGWCTRRLESSPRKRIAGKLRQRHEHDVITRDTDPQPGHDPVEGRKDLAWEPTSPSTEQVHAKEDKTNEHSVEEVVRDLAEQPRVDA
jgi:hypothetical protein